MGHIENPEKSSRGNVPYPMILTLKGVALEVTSSQVAQPSPEEEFAFHLLSWLPCCETIVIIFVIVIIIVH